MGGPSATVLFSKPMEDARVRSIIEQSVRGVLRSSERVLETPRGTTWHQYAFDGRLFLVSHGEEDPGEWQDLKERNIAALIGWQVEDQVSIGAECNDDRDHLLLGKAVLSIAAECGGVVSFTGCPPTPESTPGDAEQRFVKLTEAFPGRLYRLAYRDEKGQMLPAHEFLCDATFLRAWLIHPYFRMLK
jgi:hypothetical protein